MASRADKFTIETKKVVIYSDFTDNLDIIPNTGYLARVTNEESVKQALRNLLLTNRTERFYRPTIGSKIQSLLFEPIDDVTTQMLQTTITETIKNNEPRAQLFDVVVSPQEDINAYFIQVIFGIINIPNESFSLSVVLRRVR